MGESMSKSKRENRWASALVSLGASVAVSFAIAGITEDFDDLEYIFEAFVVVVVVVGAPLGVAGYILLRRFVFKEE